MTVAQSLDTCDNIKHTETNSIRRRNMELNPLHLHFFRAGSPAPTNSPTPPPPVGSEQLMTLNLSCMYPTAPPQKAKIKLKSPNFTASASLSGFLAQHWVLGRDKSAQHNMFGFRTGGAAQKEGSILAWVPPCLCPTLALSPWAPKQRVFHHLLISIEASLILLRL